MPGGSTVCLRSSNWRARRNLMSYYWWAMKKYTLTWMIKESGRSISKIESLKSKCEVYLLMSEGKSVFHLTNWSLRGKVCQLPEQSIVNCIWTQVFEESEAKCFFDQLIKESLTKNTDQFTGVAENSQWGSLRLVSLLTKCISDQLTEVKQKHIAYRLTPKWGEWKV